MPVLRFFIGGLENEVRRDKLNALYERRRAAQKDDPTIAVSTKMPYGLQLKDGHYVAKAPEDAAVRQAYQLKAQGYGCHVIAKRMAIIAPPMTLKDGSAHPQRWTSDRVRRLIIKPSYRGTVVDDDTWLRAQRHAREITRPTMRYEYALGGALRCECGYALVGGKGSGKRSSTFRYYFCRNVEAHGSYKHHRSDHLEAQFVSLLERLSAEDALLERFAAAKHVDGDLETMRGELANKKAELAKTDERRRAIYSAFENGSLAQADLQWRLDDLRSIDAQLEAQIATLERELANAQAARRSLNETRALVTSASSLWPTASIDDKRALAKAIANAFGGLVVTRVSSLTIGRPATIPKRSPRLKTSALSAADTVRTTALQLP